MQKEKFCCMAPTGSQRLPLGSRSAPTCFGGEALCGMQSYAKWFPQAPTGSLSGSHSFCRKLYTELQVWACTPPSIYITKLKAG